MTQTIPARPEDEGFLFQVYASTRQEEVAAWGWDAAQQEAFLRMQFTAQQRSYQWQYPTADHHIVMYEGQPVGRYSFQRAEHEIQLIDIALLPGFRSLGIGRAVIQELLTEAVAVGKPLKLSVLKTNHRARDLYERLGFSLTGENDFYYTMHFLPPALNSAD